MGKPGDGGIGDHLFMRFSEATEKWLEGAFAGPTEVQEKGWTEISAGRHVLLSAPTGSGKTLAAFLAAIDRLISEPMPAEEARCRVLYVSPLKALTVDIERNLRSPLTGIKLAAEKLQREFPEIRAAVRTGDTPTDARRDMVKHPPDILITTPESLFLLLTSAARSILASVETVIVDEIHTMAATKRGAHLAISIERLARIAKKDPQRIGLSATIKPLEEIAKFLGGQGRDVAIVDAGRRKTLQLQIDMPDDEPVETGQPAHTVWPQVGPKILELIRGHNSTIVFVNSRRHAERLAAQLNDLAGEDIVKAHHGSIAKEQRALIETKLKAGEIPALIATSSLELGIDMGAVDLVIQVGSPGTVASGMQRIGRAGHQVGGVSEGVVMPLHAADLLESVVLAERMQQAEVESTRIPRNPLDIVAQQIVAMVAMDEQSVDDLFSTISRAYPFSELSRRAFEATLDMLDGRYPSAEFAELRARVVWDRVANSVRARAGAQHLAVVSGGTIPDRGLYPVHLLDDGRTVGELDEEMVYELRPGEVFILGASSWRVAEITPQKVIVSPAPGEPGTLAFWHGDTVGRPIEVGRALGAFIRAYDTNPEADSLQRLRSAGCNEDTAWELVNFLREVKETTGQIPDDRNIVIEKFRDQIGDWRICVLTPFGSRVHAPWAIAVTDRLHQRLGIEVQSIHSDDGFAVRLPETDELPESDLLFLEPEEVVDRVTEQLNSSALFASRFRENAARALLLPRRRPGQRTPLWLQRQRSASLLQIASRYPSFPIVAETYRECLADVFDLDALQQLMRDVRSRAIRVVEVETARPSAWSRSLLFEYIAQYMYDGDAPLAERRAHALTLDRELLNDLLGSDDLRELLDPDAIDETELLLQGLKDSWVRDADTTLDLLRRLGDLGEKEMAARGATPEWIVALITEHRAFRVHIAGEERIVAVDDAQIYRDALGIQLPAGIPFSQNDTAQNISPLAQIVLRYAKTHAPFTPSDVAARYAIAKTAAERACQQLVDQQLLLGGHFHRAGSALEYCHGDVLAAIRRKSLAKLRRDVEAVPQEVLPRFQLQWHGINGKARGLGRLDEALTQLQGVALPASVWERDILPARVSDYSEGMLDELMRTGAYVWVGSGSLGKNDGRVAIFRREDVQNAILSDKSIPDVTEIHEKIRERLGRGPAFFADLWAVVRESKLDPGVDRDLLASRQGDVVAALWDLVWASEITNDSWVPLRFLDAKRQRPQRKSLIRLGPPHVQGRWSLINELSNSKVAVTEKMSGLAQQLLRRHGVVTRETVRSENIAGGFAALYPIYRVMEESGKVRRGYFVEGLGGAQFAAPGAADGLRVHRVTQGRVDLLAATDPANPYGAVLEWPALSGRAQRVAGAYVVLADGALRCYLERGGRSLLVPGELGREEIGGLIEVAQRLGRVEIEAINGIPAEASALYPDFLAAGFERSLRGLVRHATTAPAGNWHKSAVIA